jgi:hypothetical protein
MRHTVFTIVLETKDSDKDPNEILDEIYNALSNQCVFDIDEECDVSLVADVVSFDG